MEKTSSIFIYVNVAASHQQDQDKLWISLKSHVTQSVTCSVSLSRMNFQWRGTILYDFCTKCAAASRTLVYSTSKLLFGTDKHKPIFRPHNQMAFWCGSEACLWRWMASAVVNLSHSFDTVMSPRLFLHPAVVDTWEWGPSLMNAAAWSSSVTISSGEIRWKWSLILLCLLLYLLGGEKRGQQKENQRNNFM